MTGSCLQHSPMARVPWAWPGSPVAPVGGFEQSQLGRRLFLAWKIEGQKQFGEITLVLLVFLVFFFPFGLELPKP